ncbi:MAG: fumarylacetoacetate hydrolase family protein [Pseudomonadales bacterium]|jgi:2-keto-4-pentenoate hydratase/2-oxohepta-3-ene-1,7-dioic acid hydratase in catechol pathway|tara:strand:- start:1094 stop:1717 length:624 start_codon:yes stop_codon:yes gene_type:complete
MNTISVNGNTVQPSKILCVGRNYRAHIEELGNEIPDSMVVFNKPNSAISSTLYSDINNQPLHYESELAFTVKEGKLDAVGFGLDLTKRALQSTLKAKGLPWERAKAFDGAALFSAFVTLPKDIEDLSLQLNVDGEQRQAGGISLMIYTPVQIIRELESFTTLEDGDIIMTGTPAGVGEIKAGQGFEGEVLLAGKTLVSATWIAVASA